MTSCSTGLIAAELLAAAVAAAAVASQAVEQAVVARALGRVDGAAQALGCDLLLQLGVLEDAALHHRSKLVVGRRGHGGFDLAGAAADRGNNLVAAQARHIPAAQRLGIDGLRQRGLIGHRRSSRRTRRSPACRRMNSSSALASASARSAWTGCSWPNAVLDPPTQRNAPTITIQRIAKS